MASYITPLLQIIIQFQVAILKYDNRIKERNEKNIKVVDNMSTIKVIFVASWHRSQNEKKLQYLGVLDTS